MPSWMDEDAVTYAQAGVDTAEGARAVEAIKGVVHATYRPEVVGDIGGFGGLFSIAAAKDMDDPLLVSGTDGVGTKLQGGPAGRQARHRGHRLGGHVRQRHPGHGRRAAVLPGLRGHRQAEGRGRGRRSWPASARAASRRDARSSAARWPSTPASWIRTTTTCPASAWAWWTGRRCSIPRACARATCWWAWRRAACTPTATRLRARCAWRARPTTSCAIRARGAGRRQPAGRASGAHAHLREAGARRAGRLPGRRARARAHHGRRHHREPEPRAAGRRATPRWTWARGPCRPSRGSCATPRTWTRPRRSRRSTWGSGMVLVVDPAQAESRGGRARRGRRDDVPRRPHRGRGESARGRWRALRERRRA